MVQAESLARRHSDLRGVASPGELDYVDVTCACQAARMVRFYFWPTWIISLMVRLSCHRMAGQKCSATQLAL